MTMLLMDHGTEFTDWHSAGLKWGSMNDMDMESTLPFLSRGRNRL